MYNPYEQEDFYQQSDPINQSENDTPELVAQDLSVVNELETEASWQETQTQEDWSWQNEVTADSFNHQPEQSWQDLSYDHQGFNYEPPESIN